MSRIHVSQEVNHVGHQEACKYSVALTPTTLGQLARAFGKTLVPKLWLMLRNCSPSWKKQRGKSAGKKLHKSRTKLQDAAAAGKAKAQAKAKEAVKELENLLDALKDRQSETRSYILQLKRDAQESLKLAQGVGRVQEAVGKALSLRSAKPAAAPAKKAAAKPAAAKAPAKPAAKAAVKAATKPAAKPAAKKTSCCQRCETSG